MWVMERLVLVKKMGNRFYVRLLLRLLMRLVCEYDDKVWFLNEVSWKILVVFRS